AAEVDRDEPALIATRHVGRELHETRRRPLRSFVVAPGVTPPRQPQCGERGGGDGEAQRRHPLDARRRVESRTHGWKLRPWRRSNVHKTGRGGTSHIESTTTSALPKLARAARAWSQAENPIRASARSPTAATAASRPCSAPGVRSARGPASATAQPAAI